MPNPRGCQSPTAKRGRTLCGREALCPPAHHGEAVRALRTITESGGLVWSPAFTAASPRAALSFLLAIQGRVNAGLRTTPLSRRPNPQLLLQNRVKLPVKQAAVGVVVYGTGPLVVPVIGECAGKEVAIRANIFGLAERPVEPAEKVPERGERSSRQRYDPVDMRPQGIE